MRRASVGIIVVGVLLSAGCGGDGGDTTIIKKSGGAKPPAAKGRVLVGDEYRPEGDWCPTPRTCFSSFSWDLYGPDEAVGHGDAKDCAPGGTCIKRPDTAVVVSSPAEACNETRFTRLDMFGNRFELRTSPADLGCREYLLVSVPTATAPPAPADEPPRQGCGKFGQAKEVTQDHPGYLNVEVLGADCGFAFRVASGFVNAWSETCSPGCTVSVANIRCEYEADMQSVTCLAASTEVRFDLFFFDV